MPRPASNRAGLPTGVLSPPGAMTEGQPPEDWHANFLKIVADDIEDARHLAWFGRGELTDDNPG
jgi:hypothetical protein